MRFACAGSNPASGTKNYPQKCGFFYLQWKTLRLVLSAMITYYVSVMMVISGGVLSRIGGPVNPSP